ncbi:MAG: hypothetical protein OXL97_04280 [Chloroflexota bacterium]|nr:hypothetical protein [Chloroflexota bacterium]MDE2883928.1 hypothetical protein [Chloroflexota bacterium]
MADNLSGTSIKAFIQKVPEWRDKYLENNMCVFKVEAFIQRDWKNPCLEESLCEQSHRRVESLIEQLKGKDEFIHPEDDLEIVYRWGGGRGHNLFAQIKKNNSSDEIQEQMKAAFSVLADGDPVRALEELKRLKYCSDSFGTKALAMRSPESAPIWDEIAKACLRDFTIGGKKVKSYEQFIRFCEHIAKELERPAPRGGGRWYLRDIEMAIFQFGWDHGKFKGRITGELPLGR